MLVERASGNDASFLKTEIAAPARRLRADDHVVDQMEQHDSARLENSPGEAHIRFRRRRVTGGMIMHQNEGVSGVDNRGLKHFARMR